uniref:Two pore domain potassium channel family protein n=1 Tax=Fervidicoccus fontis TaxID=683846 RepID=A0A7J3ZNK7_9CREN
MTVITITTTGYGEPFEMGKSGRIVSMVLMVFGQVYSSLYSSMALVRSFPISLGGVKVKGIERVSMLRGGSMWL